MRSQMSSIMGPEHPELFTLEFGKLLNLTLFTLCHRPVSTKLGQNMCDHKISDESDYGFDRTRTV